MNSSDVGIEIESINTTINSITSLMNIVNDAVENIQSNIKRVDNCWSGKTKNGFLESISNLDYNLEAVDNNLNAIKQFLTGVTISYSLAEQANKIDNSVFN